MSTFLDHFTTLAKPARRSQTGLQSPSRYFGLWRQRRRLARLDDAALRDIGLTRAEAGMEASRPLWDAPDHWRT